ncbi:MAG: cyclic nucleotide-binding domain-containing protein [Anaerolineaceae bacterium]|nr:cyclic nucleotide-binding domain-containing protein [Anaerolineaceae bacterium]
MATVDAVLQHVRSADLFASLNAGQQAAIASAMQAFHCQPGDLLMQQDEAAPGLLLLASGAAQRHRQAADGSQLAGASLLTGDYCCEEALFHPVPAQESLVVSATDTWALLLTRDSLQGLLSQDPTILAALQRAAVPARQEVALFRGQRRGEGILTLRRRHPWSWAYRALLPVTLALLALIAASLVSEAALTLALVGAGLFLPAMWLLYLMAEWHNDYLIITDQRVIRREKTILAFEETLAELPLESVHEVSFDIPKRDTFAHVFGYGTVFIRTAGDSGNMTLPMMTAPEELQTLLIRNRQEFRRRLQDQAQASLEENMDALVAGEPLSPLPAPPGFTRHDAPGVFSTRFSDPQGNVVYRKHLSVWLGHIFLPLVLLIGSAISLLVQLMPGVVPDFGLTGLLASGIGVTAAVLWLYWTDWDWRNDMLFIGQTTLRIIHRRPMWLQDYNEQFLLTQVDSVTINRSGPLNTLMDRGDLLISLIGDDLGAERNFSKVGRPHRVQDEISGQRAAVLARREESEALRRREEFATWIDAWQTRRQRQERPLTQAGDRP